MTEFDPFARMQEKVKENEDKKGNSGGYDGPAIEQPEWYGMERGVYKPFRIIGNPFEARREPWETKLVMMSEILTDNGYAIPFVWPSQKDEYGFDIPQVDKDFFLFRLYKAISKGSYDKDTVDPKTGKQGIKIYDYIKTDAGQRFILNRTEEEEKRANSHGFSVNRPFVGKPRVIIPVWIAGDSWCEENKHTRILTSKHEAWQTNGKSGYNTDFGVPYHNFYTEISKQVVGFYGHWDIDIIIHKDKNSYDVTDANDQKVITKYGLKVNVDRLDPDFIASLNHYNLDEMIQFKVSSYHKIEKHLSKGIKQVDALLDSTFHDELKDLVAEEKARWDAEKKDKESKSATTVEKPESKSEPVREEKVEEKPVEATKGRTRQVVEEPKDDWTEETIRAKCSKIYKHWNSLDQREQDVTIASIDRFENDIPVMKKDAATAMCGEDCKYEDGSYVFTEESISMCPACGSKYK